MIDVVLALCFTSSSAASWVKRIAIIPHLVSDIAVAVCRGVDRCVTNEGTIVARKIFSLLPDVSIGPCNDHMKAVTILTIISRGLGADRRAPVHTFDDGGAGRIWAGWTRNDGWVAFEVDVESTAAILRVAICSALCSSVRVQAVVAQITHRPLCASLKVGEDIHPSVGRCCALSGI